MTPEPFETFDHCGLTVEIHYDDSAGNPFETFDQAAELRDGTREGWGEPIDLDAFTSTAHAARYLTLFGGCLVAIPYRLHDYGSGGYRACLTGTDDERVSGFVVVTPAGIETTGAPDPEEAARQDFETFRQWIDGEVFGYVVRSRDGEVLDSCWGFYGDPDGDDGVKDEARRAAEHEAHEIALDAEPPDVAQVLAEIAR
jgi:hypothetical protein